LVVVPSEYRLQAEVSASFSEPSSVFSGSVNLAGSFRLKPVLWRGRDDGSLEKRRPERA